MSKKRTLASHPKLWEKYDDIDTYGFLGPNKIRRTLKSEQEYETSIREFRKKVFKEGLESSDQWKRALQLCDLRPYQRISPLIGTNGQIVTCKKDYINTTIAHLEQATASTWTKRMPRGLDEFSDTEKDKLLEIMMTGWNTIIRKTSCGSDGIHPSWMNSFDISKIHDRNQVRKILRSSLDKKNFMSCRLALIPKKGTSEYRPIQVTNVPLRMLEKGILSQIQTTPLEKNRPIYGFRQNRSTHDAFNFIRNYLRDTTKPVVFVDMSKA